MSEVDIRRAVTLSHDLLLRNSSSHDRTTTGESRRAIYQRALTLAKERRDGE